MRAKNASTSSGARQFFEAMKLRAATAWDVIYDAVSNFGANGDTNQAAAVSLYTILSAIPLFILTIIVAANVFTSYPLLQQDILDAIRSFNPYFSEKLMDQLGHIETKKNLLGSLGLLGLLWLAAAIFSVMETALNIIFRSPKKRNYFLSKMLAISMIPLGWTLGAASLIVSAVAAFLMAQPFVLPGGIEISLGAAAGFLLRYLLPYIVTVVFSFFLYWIIPTAKNRPLVLLAGSAFFAFLMEIAKQLFAWYIANYTRYGLIFGTLEPVVILALWVFYVALIFLFCAELMASYQRRDLLLLERAMLKPHKSYLKVDERLFKKFGHGYHKGEIIFKENDKGNEMFYVLAGRVCLEKDAGEVKKILAELEPGQYFGEMATLVDAPRSASARALEDSNLAVIDSNTFTNLLRESQGIGVFMLKEFSSRLKNTNESLEEMTNLWIRLITVIHFMENPKAKISQHLRKLAKLAKKLPSEIQEVINDLARQKIIEVKDGYVVKVVRKNIWSILDIKALKDIELK
jgi:membrane protein